MFDSVKIIG